MPTSLSQLFARDAVAPSDAPAWIRARLEENEIRLTGDIENLQQRPWGLLLRMPTSAGVYFFKAIAPLYRFEAPLTAVLAQTNPESVPQLLGWDTARGWLLMRDGGARLREQIRSTRDASVWLSLLPRYARLQKTIAARVPEMLNFGTPDYQPEALPARYTEMLDATEHLYLDQPNGLTAAEHDALRALMPQLEAWCEQLRASPIPASIDHGDLHDANVFLDGDTCRIADWGDACVGHPFFSMRVVLVSVETSLDLDDYSPETAPVRDAYLAAWRDFASPQTLKELFRIAFRVAQVSGALKWYDLVRNLAPEDRMGHAHGTPALLRDFLQADMDKYPYV